MRGHGSQTAHRILIFSIAMGADYSFYVKSIETHAGAFFKVIIFSKGSVDLEVQFPGDKTTEKLS